MKHFPQKPPLGVPLNLEHPLANGLVGYWPMNEGAGNVVQDLSGNNTTGTLVKSTTWSPGKFGPCLSFNGSTDFVNLLEPPVLDVSFGQLTLAAWFKVNTMQADMCIMGKYINAWFLGLKSDTEIRFWHQGTSGNNYTDVTVPSLGITWHLVVATYNGVNTCIYIDGVDRGGAARTGSIAVNNHKVGIGANWGESAFYAFNGSIDDVMIYNRALTPAEILNLYRSPFCMFEVDL